MPSPRELSKRGLFRTATFAAGEELRRKANHYTDTCLIIDGAVDVDSGTDSAVTTLGPGSPVGAAEFLQGRAASSAVARERTTVLHIDDNALVRLEKEDPMLAIRLQRGLTAAAKRKTARNADSKARWEVSEKASLEILLCRNDEMLERAAQLRYRVYCEELGRKSPYADHTKKIIRDNLDDFGHTFIAVSDGELIGTLRANLSAEGSLGAVEKTYGMTNSPHHPDATMICTKFIVDPKHRGGPASMHLIAAMARFVIKAGARESYIDTIPSLLPLYRRLGYIIAAEEFAHCENGPSIPMVMDLTKHAERLARRVKN